MNAGLLKSWSVKASTCPGPCVLLLVLLFGLALSLLAFTGYEGGDDMQYITNACEFADGRFEVRYDFAQARLAMAGPLAILFHLFGPSIWIVAAIPLFWSLACIVLAYATGRVVYGSRHVGLLAAFFMAVFPLHVIISTQYFPDLGVAALAWISFLCFYLAEQRNRNLLHFTAGLAAGLAYMYRVTALFILVPLLLYLVYQRRFTRAYVLVALGLVTVVFVEGLAFALLFGDPLYRAQALASIATVPDRGVYEAIRAGGRLFSPLVSLSTNQEYGLFYFFIVPAVMALLWHRDKKSAPLLVFFLAVGLYTLWGTTSLSHYRNLRPWPRYMAIVTIPGVLLLARWLVSYVRSTWRWTITGVLAASCLVCIYLDNCRTTPSVGIRLHAFRAKHPDKLFVVPGHAYMDLFVANGLRPPTGVAVFERMSSGYARQIDPSITLIDDARELSDCFVAIPFEEMQKEGIPASPGWQKVAECPRDRRWFAGACESVGGFLAVVARKLSPEMGYVVYYAP